MKRAKIALLAAFGLITAACDDSSSANSATNDSPSYSQESSSSSYDEQDDYSSNEVETASSSSTEPTFSDNSAVEEKVSSSGVTEDTSSSGEAETASSSSSEITISSSSNIAESICSSSQEITESSSSIAEANCSSSEETVVSSSSESEYSSSSELISSSSEEQSSSSAVELSSECKALRSTEDQFIPMEAVFDCILPTEKVVFILRHAERDRSASGDTGDLNDNGRDQSTFLGKKLATKNLVDFYYESTKTYRTLTTNIYLSKGKGETFLDSSTVFNNDSSFHYLKDEDFNEYWFVKNSSIDSCGHVKSWAKVSQMAYDPTVCPEVFYNVDDKVKELVDKHFMYDNLNKYTIVATHDKFVAPFLISVTNRKIGLDAHNYVIFKEDGSQNNWNQNVFKHWPNYLAGAAVIVNENNERTFVPIRGLNTGYLGYHCINDSEDGYGCSRWEPNVN